ncbi:hypothetical protein ABYF32_08615 [Buchananella felis]|uniref:hypothetical protein n=1 Tax=Buchananella felis TaxID=3231492 RepID=UPI003527DA13
MKSPADLILKMHWIGVHPTPNWALKTYLDVFDQHFPELAPHQWGRPRRPLDAAARTILLSDKLPDIYIHLWHRQIVKRAKIRFPFIVDADTLEIRPDTSSTYSINCMLQISLKSLEMSLRRVEDLLVKMADALGAELAVCYKYEDIVGENISNKEFTRLMRLENSYYHGASIYGLPEQSTWLLWLGERFSTQMNEWLQESAPTDWEIRQTERGTFVKISSEPTSPTEQPKTWFPRSYLPRRTIFGNVKPAKTLPRLAGVYGKRNSKLPQHP